MPQGPQDLDRLFSEFRRRERRREEDLQSLFAEFEPAPGVTPPELAEEEARKPAEPARLGPRTPVGRALRSRSLRDAARQAARGLAEAGLAIASGVTTRLEELETATPAMRRFTERGRRGRPRPTELVKGLREDVAGAYGEPETKAGVAARIGGRFLGEAAIFTAPGTLAVKLRPGAGLFTRIKHTILTGAPFDVAIASAGPEESIAGGLAEVVPEGKAKRTLRKIAEDPRKRIAFEVTTGAALGTGLELVGAAGGRALARRRVKRVKRALEVAPEEVRLEPRALERELERVLAEPAEAAPTRLPEERAPAAEVLRFRVALDNLDALRQAFGDEAGDEALQAARRALEEGTRTGDLLAVPEGDALSVTLRVAPDADVDAVRARLSARVDDALREAGLDLAQGKRIGASVRGERAPQRELPLGEPRPEEPEPAPAPAVPEELEAAAGRQAADYYRSKFPELRDLVDDEEVLTRGSALEDALADARGEPPELRAAGDELAGQELAARAEVQGEVRPGDVVEAKDVGREAVGLEPVEPVTAQRSDAATLRARAEEILATEFRAPEPRHGGEAGSFLTEEGNFHAIAQGEHKEVAEAIANRLGMTRRTVTAPSGAVVDDVLVTVGQEFGWIRVRTVRGARRVGRNAIATIFRRPSESQITALVKLAREPDIERLAYELVDPEGVIVYSRSLDILAGEGVGPLARDLRTRPFEAEVIEIPGPKRKKTKGERQAEGQVRAERLDDDALQEKRLRELVNIARFEAEQFTTTGGVPPVRLRFEGGERISGAVGTGKGAFARGRLTQARQRLAALDAEASRRGLLPVDDDAVAIEATRGRLPEGIDVDWDDLDSLERGRDALMARLQTDPADGYAGLAWNGVDTRIGQLSGRRLQDVVDDRAVRELRAFSVRERAQLYAAELDRGARAFGSVEEANLRAAEVVESSAKYADVSLNGFPTAERRLEIVRQAEQARAWVDIRGHKAESVGDLAAMLEPFRDPRFERLHVILLDERGVILSHTMETSGALDYVSLVAEGERTATRWVTRVARRAKRVGAKKAIVVHNHPSGDPSPSFPDLAFTRAIAQDLQRAGVELDGQLIIDRGRAHWILPSGERATRIEVTPRADLFTQPAQLSFAPDWTEAAGARVLTPSDVFNQAHGWDFAEDRFYAVYLDVQNHVVAVEPHRMEALAGIGRWLPERQRAMGARSAILALDDRVGTQFERAIAERNVAELRDVLDVVNLIPRQSAAQMGRLVDVGEMILTQEGKRVPRALRRAWTLFEQTDLFAAASRAELGTLAKAMEPAGGFGGALRRLMRRRGWSPEGIAQAIPDIDPQAIARDFARPDLPPPEGLRFYAELADLSESEFLDEVRREMFRVLEEGTPYQPRPRAAGLPAVDEIDPAEHVNFAKFAVDPAGERRLADEVIRVVKRHGLHPKRPIPWEEVRRIADQLGLEPENVLRREAARLAGPELLAIRNIVSANVREMVTIERRLLTEVLSDANQRILERTVSALEVQNDALLSRFIRARSQKGRDLNNLKIIAKAAPDPFDRFLWLTRAKKMLGDWPLTERVRVQVVSLINEKDLDGLIRYVASLRKAHPLEKLTTLWKAGLLTSPTTHAANILGNTTMLGLETAKDVPAFMLDRLLSATTSLVSGGRVAERTKSGAFFSLARARGRGAVKGARQAADVIRGRGLGDALQRYDIYRDVNFDNAILDTYTKGVFRLLAAEDRVFRVAALEASLAEQALVLARTEGYRGRAFDRRVLELLRNPTDEMAVRATLDAEHAIFTNRGILAELATGLKRTAKRLHPGAAAAVEFVLPFARTPANVAARVVEYGPLGAVSTLPDLVRLFREATKGVAVPALQKKIAERLGRASVGTAPIVVGWYLASHGRMTADFPQDQATRDEWALQGKQENSVLLGGRWRSLNRISPFGNLMALGAHLWHAFDDPDKSATEAIATGLASIATTVSEQTFLTGLRQVLEAGTDPQRFATDVANQYAKSWIPNFVRRVTAGLDPTLREPEGLVEQLLSQVPLVSRRLPARVTQLGEPLDRERGVLGQLFDPFTSRTARGLEDPVIGELERVGAHITRLKRDKKAGETAREFEERATLYGQELREALTEIIESEEYQELAAAARDLVRDDPEAVAALATTLVEDDPEYRGLDPDEVAQQLLQEPDEVARKLQRRVLRRAIRDTRSRITKSLRREEVGVP